MPELTEFRDAKDHYFAHDHDSPLTPEQVGGFTGLNYYDERPELRFVVEPDRLDEREPVEMQTSTGDVATFTRWGKVRFEVDGDTAELAVYKDSRGGYFVPFADATSSNETYGAGRYLELEDLPNGRVLVDFNYAYNPYCAYNESWSCPLTPSENRLKVPIRAGEKSFK